MALSEDIQSAAKARLHEQGAMAMVQFLLTAPAPADEGSSTQRPRRRRTFSELERDHVCPHVSCSRCYASKHALQQHIRLKHQSPCAKAAAKRSSSSSSSARNSPALPRSVELAQRALYSPRPRAMSSPLTFSNCATPELYGVHHSPLTYSSCDSTPVQSACSDVELLGGSMDSALEAACLGGSMDFGFLNAWAGPCDQIDPSLLSLLAGEPQSHMSDIHELMAQLATDM